ncbi:MAG: hypothetical protein AMXMBFR4_25030 [Candidatus Hydrogenedentota bacterium]
MIPVALWKRVIAYLVDVMPITLLLAGAAYFLLGFDEVWERYRADRQNPAVRADFLFKRNLIRDSSLILWVLYCTLFEASRLQATLGKWFVGAAVVTENGDRMDLRQAFIRNATKLISMLPLFVGCMWAVFNPQRQAWHDRFAKTCVVTRKSLMPPPIP